MAATTSTPINSYAGWQTVQLTSPIDVNEGQTIWLAWVFETNLDVRWKSGTPGRAASGEGWAYGMPSDFGSSTLSIASYSIYATYTSDEQDQEIELLVPKVIGNPYLFTGRRFDLEILRPHVRDGFAHGSGRDSNGCLFRATLFYLYEI